MARVGRGRGRLIWLALVATVLGVAVWVGTGAPVDAGRLKSTLQRSVLQSTGRELTIAGPLHIAMGLSPRVTAEGISLANVTGGSAPLMLSAKTLSAQVALLPLLGGHVVLEDVTLDGVGILVEAGPDGKPNWQFQPQRHTLVPQGETAASSGGGGALDVHHVRFQDAHVIWNLPAGRSLVADFDQADVTSDSADSPLQGTAKGRAYGVPIGLTVRAGSLARLQGGPVTALEGAWPLDAALSAGTTATLKLSGGINHPDEWRGYTFMFTATAADLKPLAPWLPPALALPLHDVNLSARLSDGNNSVFRTSAVSLHAGAADLSAAVPGLMLKEAVLSAPGPGQQVQANIDGSYDGAPLRLAATSTQPDTLGGVAPLPIVFSAEVGSASFSARGTVPPSLTANGFDLTVALQAPNLADLSSLARRPLPDVRNVNFGGHLGDAGFRLRGLDIRDIGFQSSLGDAAGNLTVAWAPVLTLKGTLASKQFDLDAALAAWSMLTAPDAASPTPALPPPAPATPQAATLIPDNDLPFAALHGADGDLTLTVDRMTAGGEAYRDVSAKMVASGGRVVVNPLRMTAPQGLLVGGLTVDASAAPPQVALTFHSPGLAAAKIASLFGYSDGASGQLQVDAQLSSAGASPHALASSLDGHLGLTIVNGTVNDALLQTILGSALSRAGVPPFDGDVAVRCFASRTDFTHGVGHVRALALDTPQTALDATGDIDLGEETVALHLRPTVRIGGTGIAAPVSLTGGFGALKAALDPALDGRFGFSIGVAAPSGTGCFNQLFLARGGFAGPLPLAPRPVTNAPVKQPTDLLRGLFH